MDENSGLARALRVGDYVILSTGATARTRAAYAAGFAGDVALELDGQAMTELAGRLTLPEPERAIADSEEPAVDADRHLTREGDHRMHD